MKSCEIKTLEIKQELQKLVDTPYKWTLINGEYYVYNKATNTVRVKRKQPSGEIAALIGCFFFREFIWCC